MAERQGDLNELLSKLPEWEDPKNEVTRLSLELEEVETKYNTEIERLKVKIRKQCNVLLSMRNCYNCVKMQSYCEL